jgi:hypothetical protein
MNRNIIEDQGIGHIKPNLIFFLGEKHHGLRQLKLSLA